jgi:hypothetical protein
MSRPISIPRDLADCIRFASRGRVVTWLCEAVARQWLHDLGSELAAGADPTAVLRALLGERVELGREARRRLR